MDEKGKGLRLSTLLDVLEPGTQISINTDSVTYTGDVDETPYYLTKLEVKLIEIWEEEAFAGLLIRI